MNELKLRDIKPIVDISDNSLYMFIALIVAILLIIGAFSYFLYKKRAIAQRRYKKSETFRAKEALKSIDFNKTKDAVYNFSKYAQFLANSEQKKSLEPILQSLEKYKFKKETEALSKSDISAMKKFIKEVV